MRRTLSQRAHESFERTKKGFTVVKLRLFIVAVTILAAIIIIVFNNFQARANFTREQAELQTIVNALELYHVDHNAYPSTIKREGCTDNWCGWNQATGDAFIDGIAPEYISVIPQMPTDLPPSDSYIYLSDGKLYQLLRYRGDGLPAIEKQNNPLLVTTDGYNGLAWGYRSAVSGPWL